MFSSRHSQLHSYTATQLHRYTAPGATLLGSERADDYPLAGYIQYPYSSTVRPASLLTPCRAINNAQAKAIEVKGDGQSDAIDNTLAFKKAKARFIDVK
ncbi:hypothetical protein ACQKP6_06740 [Pseudomonas fluorescens]|uniref:hypothetical protein n=1 Tax=Pseudomonas fluorescens TaxID=294 RepID=UPI003D00AD18